MVVKSKQRVKKSAIKKWEQTYTVPIPYFGLMQIERDTRSSRYGNTENDTQVQYWGSIEKVFEGIPIAVSVSIRGEIEYFDIGNTDSMYEDDIPKEEYYRRRSLSQDNSSGASVAYYSGRVVIRDPSTDSDHSAIYYNYIAGTGRDYGGPDFGSFMSIEDAINHVGEVVEDFFPKVMEYVNQEKMASTKKSKDGRMAKRQAVMKSVWNTWYSSEDNLQDALSRVDKAYQEWYDSETPSNDEESRLYNEIESDIDDLVDKINEYIGVLNSLVDAGKVASTKKSKYAKLHKALNKIGGFTKEGDEEEGKGGHTVSEMVGASEHPGSQRNRLQSIFDNDEDSEEEETVEVESEDESEKGCKSAKAFRTSKRVKMKKKDEDPDEEFWEDFNNRENNPDDWPDDEWAQRKSRKTKKAEDMPADADDFQNDNQKGSGSAGSELPEDADDQQDENDPGSGNAGKELPEDANEQEDQKQARARKMRKFSVTPGGQPNQESYNQRYSQAPMVRQAIDGHFSAKSEKSFDEVQMMQDRIDEIIKSKRNKTNNGVPQKIRRY